MPLNYERGKKYRPQRVCLYAPEGIGKSDLASQLPSPIFLDFEDGTDHLDVFRLKPKTLNEAERILGSLEKDREGFETVVIDTIDWMEEAVIRQIITDAENDRIKSIEDFGFGKGYVVLTERMNLLLTRFDRLIEAGMHVVLLAHAMVTKFDDPRTGGAYDRFELKMHKDRKGAKGTASLIKEWVDALLFGQYDDKVRETGEGANVRHRAVASSGKTRFLYCTHSAAWDAKNRHGLSDREPWGIETLTRIIGKPAAPAAPAAPVKPVKAAPKPEPAEAPGKAASGAEASTTEAPNTAPTEPLPVEEDPIPGLADEEAADPELSAICLGEAKAVNAFLRQRGQIGERQTYRSVSAEYRARILSNPAAFMQRVKAAAEGRTA